MPINPKTKGIATLWLIIAGFILIVGSGAYWFSSKNQNPMSDLEWFVKDEERLNREIGKPDARQSEIQPPANINSKCEVKNSQQIKSTSGGGAPPAPAGVPPNSSNVVALVKNCAIWPPGSIPPFDYGSYSPVVVYSLTVEIKSSSAVQSSGPIYLDSLAVHGRVYDVFSKEPLSAALVGKNISASLKLKESTSGVRWWISDISIQADLADTLNWQTYRNEKYGFEVKYPGGWITDWEEEGRADLKIIGRVVNPARAGRPDTDVPIEQFLVRSFNSECNGSPNSILGIEAMDSGWEKGFGNIFYRDFCIKTSHWPITFSMSAVDGSSQKIMDQILSTLKFLE